MADIKRATFTVEKCRGGYYVQVQTNNPHYDPEEDDYDSEMIDGDSFVLPGDDLDATDLGKGIIASIVANRITNKKRR